MLDAPELQDDFYLNLVDWSAGNLLSVGLGACVYLWSACTSQVGRRRPAKAHGRGATPKLFMNLHLRPQVTRLCDLSVDGDSVTSVCWNERVSKDGEFELVK